MQIVHEVGHVLAAWASGGMVERVVLHPLRISRTDLSLNPAPLLVAWAGPLVGSIVPSAAWGLARWRAARFTYLLRFFAGFCLVANGAYLGAGVFRPVGDAGDILRLGGARWTLVLFGGVAVAVGFRVWHGLGPAFGLGDGLGQVSRRHSLAMLLVFLLLVAVELIAGR